MSEPAKKKPTNWPAMIVEFGLIGVLAFFAGPAIGDALTTSPGEKAFHLEWDEKTPEEQESLCSGVNNPDIRALYSKEMLDEFDDVCR